MNLIAFSFSGVLSDRLLIYTFLYTMGFNILMWSLVPLFLSRRLRSGFNFRVLMNAPVMAIVFSLVWVGFMGKGSLPGIINEPVRQLGLAAFPVAMIILGAYLSRYRAHRLETDSPVMACVFTKLFLFPVLILSVLFFTPMSSDYKFFLFLQSIMPTAVSLVVIGSYTGANNRFLSSCIFYSHIAVVFTIPLWFEVFRRVIK
ncbi:MAG: AEC family transporter [Candidatus Omnitrophota bacterium]